MVLGKCKFCKWEAKDHYRQENKGIAMNQDNQPLPKEAIPPKEWWHEEEQEAFLKEYKEDTLQHRGIAWKLRVNEDGVFAINYTAMPYPAFMPWLEENDTPQKTYEGLLEQIDLTLEPEAEDLLVTSRKRNKQDPRVDQALDLVNPPRDTRPARGVWAPGNVLRICRKCKSPFAGDRDALHCAECTYSGKAGLECPHCGKAAGLKSIIPSHTVEGEWEDIREEKDPRYVLCYGCGFRRTDITWEGYQKLLSDDQASSPVHKLRLLLWETCQRSCEGCCNKDWDLNTLGAVSPEEIRDAQLIMLTGGEPMLFPALVHDVIRFIRKHTSAPVYVYTAKVDSLDAAEGVLAAVDGITVTLHEQEDVAPFLDFVTRTADMPRVKRVNVFHNVDLPYVPEGWACKPDIDWIADCPLPEGEIFRKMPLSLLTETPNK